MGETKIILGFGVLVSCLSPMIAGSSPSDLSQGPSLEAEWAFALPEGVEVVDVIILRDGQIAYTTTQSRFVNVLSVDGAPADSIELPHPPFSVAVNVAGGWEAIDLSAREIHCLDPSTGQDSVRPLNALDGRQLLTAARTSSGWIGVALDRQSDSASLVPLDRSAEGLVARIAASIRNPADVWVSGASGATLVAEIHGSRSTRVFGTDGSLASTIVPQRGFPSQGEWVQLRPVPLGEHLLLSFSNLHSDERVFVLAPMLAEGGEQREVRLDEPLGFVAADSDLGAVVGVRRLETQQIVKFRVERRGPESQARNPKRRENVHSSIYLQHPRVWIPSLHWGPLTAQECENCLSEGGFYEDCDNDEGHDGWYDCQLILWIICYGTQPCDWEDADAIALGADGMKMGQMSLAEIQRERAKESLYSPMGLHPVSGPWAPDSAGPSTKWRDCRGAIVGTFRDAGEIEAIRKTTNQIRF